LSNFEYILSKGIIKRVADLVYFFRILSKYY